MTEHPVFFDPKNRRAGHVSKVAWTIAVMSTVAGAIFLSSFFILRTFPETLRTSPSQRYALLNEVAKVRHLLPSVRNLAVKAQSKRRGYSIPGHPLSMAVARAKGVRAAIEGRSKPLTIGFYANWDDSSYASLKSNLQNLDWVVPSWLYLQGENMELNSTLDARASDIIRRDK